MKLRFSILLFFSAAIYGQTVNPNQIRPGVPNQVMITPPSGATQWSSTLTGLTSVTSGITNLTVNPMGPQFGAVCDGVHDDGPAINAALASLLANGGGTLQFPPKRCLSKEDIVITPAATGSNISIVGTPGASELYFNPTSPFVAGVNREALFIEGVESARRQIASAIPLGATTFTASSSGDTSDLSAGDWVEIGEYDLGAGSGGIANVVVYDWEQVASVASTVVTVKEPFRTAFPDLRPWNPASLSGLGFRKVTSLLSNIKIQGIKITQPAQSQTLCAILPNYGIKGLTLRDVTVDNANGNAICSFEMKGLDLDNFTQLASRNQITEFAATVDMHIHDSYFGQEITTNSPTDVGNPAFNVDLGTAFFDISGNVLLGSGNGEVLFSTGAHDGSFSGNKLGYEAIGASSQIGGRGAYNITSTANHLAGCSTCGFGFDFQDSTGYTVNIASTHNVSSNDTIPLTGSYTAGPYQLTSKDFAVYWDATNNLWTTIGNPLFSTGATLGSQGQITAATFGGQDTQAAGQVRWGNTGTYVHSMGPVFSTGGMSLNTNAYQKTFNTDLWHQANSAAASSLFQFDATSGLKMYLAASSTADGTFAAFWGSPRWTIDQNGVANFTAYQLSGVAKTFSPIRAGTWSISSATSVAVTFATAMGSAPTSCSVTPGASAATTGTPFATSLGTGGFTVNVPTSGTLSGTYQCVINNAN